MRAPMETSEEPESERPPGDLSPVQHGTESLGTGCVRSHHHVLRHLPRSSGQASLGAQYPAALQMGERRRRWTGFPCK